jgi:hypothetical protein
MVFDMVFLIVRRRFEVGEANRAPYGTQTSGVQRELRAVQYCFGG